MNDKNEERNKINKEEQVEVKQETEKELKYDKPK
jgi:hypothetical protein